MVPATQEDCVAAPERGIQGALGESPSWSVPGRLTTPMLQRSPAGVLELVGAARVVASDPTLCVR